ncbi:ECF transporter S component [Acidipropionibacterium jensenii]|uniref:ECF transporter S component n=1 Tax=Acidipropionibacterium jensenii TaxID=1749 RepID=UPI00110B70CD|nr:ECF transporter S component [Acidipropionibacterium jensenii]QCV89373.1 ECF transporter S component [Acidipropionibacterium jensenii]
MRQSAVSTPRTARITLALTAVLGLVAFGWPLLLSPGSQADYETRAPFLLAGILVLAVAIVVSQLGANGIDAKALAMLGVLTACGAALRPLGTGTAGIEFVFLLIILGGRVFGAGFGFLLGATTFLTSALLTAGFGAWLPYQMVAAGFVGLGAGLLPSLSRLGERRRALAETAMLAGYGFLTAFGYGWLMDFAFWPFTLGLSTSISYSASASIGTNLWHFVLYNLATSMAWNLGRALTNVVLIVLVGQPVMRVLRRAARRASWSTPGPVPEPVPGTSVDHDRSVAHRIPRADGPRASLREVLPNRE